MNEFEREFERETEVLSRHWRQESGMSAGSPDRCACGVETRPKLGDEDVSDRRARAFAEHQAMMLASGRRASK